jgi:hypothetical protein
LLDLAGFVLTRMPADMDKITMETINKNPIDQDE